MIHPDKGLSILSGNACGPVVAMEVGLSFWGGVDPGTGVVIDVHHKQHGAALPGAIVLMPTSRGSCSGSGVLLELALCKAAPAALIFSEPEDTLTLGAIVAAEMFGAVIPVLRLPTDAFAAVAAAKSASIFHSHVEIDGVHIELERPYPSGLTLQPSDRAMIDGAHGPAVSQAMRILSAMALQQGAAALTDVTRAHIDGCIYAGPANLIFAETMERLGARVRIPATMNAISVDQENWQWQGVPTAFGEAAARLADSYVSMGCDPTFTCAPYLLDDAPSFGEPIGWSESNAVIFANSVLGARSAKHPDFLDLCIALTGRAPLTGVFLDENRRARCIIDVEFPADADPAVWPLIGYVAGLVAPDCVPLIRGVAGAKPTQDDLKALCAAFGTTSAAPMIHIEGVTPEAADGIAEGATYAVITRERLAESWMKLNDGLEQFASIANQWASATRA